MTLTLRKIISLVLYTACTVPIALGTIMVISFIESNGGLHTFWRVGDVDILTALLCIGGVVFWVGNIIAYKLERITQPRIIDHFRPCYSSTMAKFLVSFVIFIVVFTSSFFVPRVFIDNNVEHFEGEKRLFASYALQSAQSLMGGSLESLILTKLQVEEIAKVENEQNGESCDYGSDNPYASIQNEYAAIVKGYTVFGLPYTKIYVYCTGAAKIEF